VCVGSAGQGECGPVEGTKGEGEEGKREEEDQVVGDDLYERGRDEEDADGAEEDCAAVVLKAGRLWQEWGRCGVFGEETVAEKAEGEQEEREVAGVEVVADEEGDDQREWEGRAAGGGPGEKGD